VFAIKYEGVLVVGSAMVNTGIQYIALMVGFAAGVIEIRVGEVGSR